MQRRTTRSAAREEVQSREDPLQNIAHPIDAAVGQTRMERETEDPTSEFVGDSGTGRADYCVLSEPSEGVQRLEMHACADVGSSKNAHDVLPRYRLGQYDHHEMMGMTRLGCGRYASQPVELAELVTIARNQGCPASLKSVQPLKLGSSEDGKNVGKVGFDPGLDQVVAPVGPQPVTAPSICTETMKSVGAGEGGQIFVGCGQRSALTGGEVLRRIERVAGCHTSVTGENPSGVGGAECMGCIFHDGYTGRPTHFVDAAIHREPTEMDHHQCAEPIGQGRFHSGRRKVQRISLYVEEHRHCAMLDRSECT